MKARLQLRFSDLKILDTVDYSLEPDNVDFPSGMKFLQKSSKGRKELAITIMFKESEARKIETLISTLDEILSHVYSSTRTVEKAEAV